MSSVYVPEGVHSGTLLLHKIKYYNIFSIHTVKHYNTILHTPRAVITFFRSTCSERCGLVESAFGYDTYSPELET